MFFLPDKFFFAEDFPNVFGEDAENHFIYEKGTGKKIILEDNPEMATHELRAYFRKRNTNLTKMINNGVNQ